MVVGRPYEHEAARNVVHEREYFPGPSGKSYYIVTCPECNRDVKAFAWSLAGRGERCECGALHHWTGTLVRKVAGA